MPPPSSDAFRQSLAPTSAYARHRSHAAAQTTLYGRPPPAAAAPPRTERDVLLTHHRFLRSPSASPTRESSDDYEKALVSAYDKKLYKEFVLISLGRWREGMVAMRWRTEEEVRRGKGETGCAELACEMKGELGESEVLFAYVEHGEKKEALVKVRLCRGCGEKLRKAREREKREGRSRDGRRSRSRSPKRRSEDRGRRRRSGDDRSRSPNRHSDGRSEDRERRKHRRRDRSGSPKDSDRSRRRRSRSSHGHREKSKVL